MPPLQPNVAVHNLIEFFAFCFKVGHLALPMNAWWWLCWWTEAVSAPDVKMEVMLRGRGEVGGVGEGSKWSVRANKRVRSCLHSWHSAKTVKRTKTKKKEEKPNQRKAKTNKSKRIQCHPSLPLQPLLQLLPFFLRFLLVQGSFDNKQFFSLLCLL